MEIIAAAVCGFLSGLGIGGGSLLIVWLTAAVGMAQITARGINLLYFLPTAAVSLIFHSRNRFVDWRAALWAILGGVLFAALGAYAATQLATTLLQKLFGAFLIFIGVSELLTKKN